MERREDMRFLRGRGEYVDDVAMPGLLYAVILRSSVAHGRLVSINASAALKVPGVHVVITAKDMPGGPPIVPMRLQPLPEFKPFEQPVIAHDKVRYVGGRSGGAGPVRRPARTRWKRQCDRGLPRSPTQTAAKTKRAVRPGPTGR
jgi:CO/xanthine dehydrogenase Mo-binding subunit